MSDMSPAELYALAATDPEAAGANAIASTHALADSVLSLLAAARVLVVASIVALLAKAVIICCIWRAINGMAEDSERRHAEHSKRHAEAMAKLRRNGKALDARIRRSGGRRGVLSTRHIGRRYRV